jgi:hypothetical protein
MMKNGLTVLFATLLAATVAFGALGDVVASFAAPASNPLALARPTNVAYLWVYCNTSPYLTWRVHGTTGSIYGSWVTGSYTRGLTYEYGGYLYRGNTSTDYIYRCSSSNPTSIYSSYPAGHDMYSGLALEAGAGGSSPTAMYSSSPSPAYIWRHNYSTGSIYSSFAASIPCDPAWDYNNKLIWAGNYSTHYIYGYYANGSLVASFASPANYPWGLTYYGNYLWVSTTIGTNRIWQVHVPTFTSSISPASMGKIKAMYK